MSSEPTNTIPGTIIFYMIFLQRGGGGGGGQLLSGQILWFTGRQVFP